MPRRVQQPRPGGKSATSFYLSPDFKRLLRALSARYGVPMSSMLELIVRQKAKEDGLL